MIGGTFRGKASPQAFILRGLIGIGLGLLLIVLLRRLILLQLILILLLLLLSEISFDGSAMVVPKRLVRPAKSGMPACSPLTRVNVVTLFNCAESVIETTTVTRSPTFAAR